MSSYLPILLRRQTRRLCWTLRAYLARPDLLSPAHDHTVYEMARGIGHTGLQLRPDLCPGWQPRY